MAAAAVLPPVAAGPPGQPDIACAPDLEKWQARTQRRQQTETLATSLPDGFPDKLASDLVWDGNTVAETYDWNYVLTDADVVEIDAALGHFKCEDLVYPVVTPLQRVTELAVSFGPRSGLHFPGNLPVADPARHTP